MSVDTKQQYLDIKNCFMSLQNTSTQCITDTIKNDFKSLILPTTPSQYLPRSITHDHSEYRINRKMTYSHTNTFRYTYQTKDDNKLLFLKYTEDGTIQYHQVINGKLQEIFPSNTKDLVPRFITLYDKIYMMGDLVGSGAHGIVHKYTCTEDPTKSVALKHCSVNCSDVNIIESLSSIVGNPCTAGYINFHIATQPIDPTRNTKYIFMDLYDGDMHTVIDIIRSKTDKEKIRAEQLAEQVKFEQEQKEKSETWKNHWDKEKDDGAPKKLAGGKRPKYFNTDKVDYENDTYTRPLSPEKQKLKEERLSQKNDKHHVQKSAEIPDSDKEFKKFRK